MLPESAYYRKYQTKSTSKLIYSCKLLEIRPITERFPHFLSNWVVDVDQAPLDIQICWKII